MRILGPRRVVHFANSLSSIDARSLIFVCSLGSYLAFKRFEPYSLVAHLGLLALVPLLVGYVTKSHFSSLPVALSTAFISHNAFVLLFVVIYRLSPFHPLARYPGPVLNRLTKLRMTYILSRGKQHLYYQGLFREYGDVVRTGPNELMFANADAIGPMLGSQGLPKGPWWDGTQDGKILQLIGIRDNAEAARRRKLWHRGFSPTSLHEYEAVIIRHVRRFFDALDQRLGSPLDISQWNSYFTFDFMGEMAFGKPFDLVEKGRDPDGHWDVINGGVRVSHIQHSPWLWSYIRGLPWSGAANARLRKFSNAQAEYRLIHQSKSRDLFYHLMDEDNVEPVKPSREQVISDAQLAVVAGSDTTASVLSSIWFFLLFDRDTYRRLQTEVDSVFPDGADFTDFKKLERMPFLNACINEALRLYPPVPSGSQRSIMRGAGGKMICGQFVPEQTQVSVHTYTVHRDPRYFSPAPDTFWPDRWLPATDRKNTPVPESIQPFVHDTNAFVPFSHGPARCAGKALATAEMRAMVCGMVQRYEIEAAPGFKPEVWAESIKDYFVIERGAVDVVLRQRSDT